jgi:hypothetical protein
MNNNPVFVETYWQPDIPSVYGVIGIPTVAPSAALRPINALRAIKLFYPFYRCESDRSSYFIYFISTSLNHEIFKSLNHEIFKSWFNGHLFG